MNETASTLIRSVLKVGGGFAVAKGYTDDSTATLIIGGLTALIGVIWGIFAKKPPVAP